MHALHSLILIVIIADAFLEAKTSEDELTTASHLGGTPQADNPDISVLLRRWPGVLPAVSSLALLIATIVGFLGIRRYSSIKGHGPNETPGQHKRNIAEGGQSPCLVSFSLLSDVRVFRSDALARRARSPIVTSIK